ncbi:MAG: HD domain-containing protein [Candidatus Omnitrophica bacterium]|nr:HD domain-containing protein [Candidatus Omnitrophota bacterium]
MKKSEDKWIWQFIVDPDPAASGSSSNRITAYPGDPYDARRCPEIMKALNLPSADKVFTSDEWGHFLSAYAPIRDSRGNVVAALGIDMLAGDVSNLKREIYKRTVLILILGIVISILLGLIISGRITRPVKKLVEGTRHIAAQDLDYEVDIKGNDEMAQMGKAFNGMAQSLFEYRAKLHDYFYRVVQSLVRMLEAKDKYTSGHSERVAGYAADIGRAMGLSEERVGVLKKAAEIHDIGKLVIHENLLNKKEKLTNEEWLAIREHPVLGGEILKPALLDDETMSVVRSHHERYDGTGYPDQLVGDKINLLAQIISVADAYDAMTSPRSYRGIISKDKALEELKKGSGTQFNPEAVRKFIEVMK